MTQNPRRTTIGLSLLIIAIVGLIGFVGFFLLPPTNPLSQILSFILALFVIIGAIFVFTFHRRTRHFPSGRTTPPPPDQPANILKEASPQTPDQPVLESKPLKDITDRE